VSVFYRDDNLGDWVAFSTGLPSANAPTEEVMEIVQSIGKIRLGTWGRGMWESDLYSFNPANVCKAPLPPQVSNICPPNQLSSGTPPAGYSVQWYKGGVEIPGATGTTYTPDGPGKYQARFLNGSCNSLSSESIVVQDLTALPESVPDGEALDLDGSNDYVDIGNQFTPGVSDYTVECWFYLDGTPSGTDYLFDFGWDFNIHQGIRVNSSTLEYEVSWWNGSKVGLALSGPTPGLNQWHHVAVSYNSSNDSLKLYLNGQVLAKGKTNVEPSLFNAHGRDYLGQRVNGAEPFSGKIDEFRYWSVTRTQQEIQNNM